MSKNKIYKTKTGVWLWNAENGISWHFVTLSKKDSEEIKEKYGKGRRGFGSIRVEVIIGETTWKTSIFPEKTSGRYILPIKAAVRKAEDIEAEESVSVTVKIV